MRNRRVRGGFAATAKPLAANAEATAVGLCAHLGELGYFVGLRFEIGVPSRGVDAALVCKYHPTEESPSLVELPGAVEEHFGKKLGWVPAIKNVILVVPGTKPPGAMKDIVAEWRAMASAKRGSGFTLAGVG